MSKTENPPSQASFFSNCGLMLDPFGEILMYVSVIWHWFNQSPVPAAFNVKHNFQD